VTIEFRGSERRSIGMEMEFQLVNAEDGDLVDGIVPLMEIASDDPRVKPEFIQNCVEVASQPCESVDELGRDLGRSVSRLTENCRALDMRLVGAGTHPFSTRLAAITPGPRYEAMEQTSGLLGHRQITFSTHVHVSVANGDEAVWLARQLAPYLPLLLALSASSPFWQGHDTRFAAFRPRILASARTYCLPPEFADWGEFESCMAFMARSGKFDSVDRLHWYLRPRPAFGTLEVRIMDAQPSVAEALALAAFVQALVAFIRESRDRPESRLAGSPDWALVDNCFLASRFGLDARIAVNREGDVMTLLDVARETLEHVGPAATRFGDADHLASLAQRVSAGLPADRQRRTFAETGSLRAVVDAAVDDLLQDPLVS
jgi:carboxylate-amine ligase